ncbi:MAG TPA: SDR family oxidoreductase [Pirellulales bacterium]|jgi:NAD(P)-dependent dehydrogenase (short-subunit alcohol dehydrogenase family)|nr:SDR family oxidoreductase [Pirellulales bacterium]
MPNAPTTSVLDLFRLEGRRALITGGSKGLGRTIATALAQAGADIVITSRTADDCGSAARAIRGSTARTATAIAADISLAGDVDRLYQAATKDGPIDILVNSAGVNIRNPVGDISEADWDTVLNVNLKGPFLLARRFGPAMAERGWGRLIQLGSIMSVVSLPERTPYASSKAGILGLTRTLALEWAGKGVTVNAICPGPFATDMNKPLLADPAKYAAFVSKIPMGRWGELHEITGAALFLASPASSFVTGTTLFVDGGWTAQ